MTRQKLMLALLAAGFVQNVDFFWDKNTNTLKITRTTAAHCRLAGISTRGIPIFKQ